MDFLIHLAKSSLYLLLFYGFYRLILRYTTFFYLNRGYLVLALILSPLLPFIQVNEEVTIVDQSARLAEQAIGIEPVIAPSTGESEVVTIGGMRSAGELLVVVYATGVLVFLLMFLRKLREFYRYRRQYSLVFKNSVPVRVADYDNGLGSFSFLGRIFMSGRDFKHHFDEVYNHEKVHVRQWHSFDILLTELAQIVFWFNPVIRHYKHALQEIHESLADTSASGDRDAYVRFLLSYTFSEMTEPMIANTFYNSGHLKHRVQMLYKKRDSRRALIRYLPIVPLIFLSVLLTASRQYTYVSQSVPPGKDHSTLSGSFVFEEVASSVAKPAAIENEREIKGKITNAADEKPLTGATVVVKGSSIGTTTDLEGKFSIRLPEGQDQIVVSFIGFISQTIRIGSKTTVAIALQKDNTQLEELVVVGYQGVRKSASLKVETPKSMDENGSVFTVVEQMPEYPGGISEMYRYLSRNIRYPLEAAEAGIQGRVHISFIVNKRGGIREPRVVKSVGYGTDEEALRVVISMPRWKPALQNGQPVDMEYTLPITFQLETPEKSDRQGVVSPIYDLSGEEKKGSLPERTTTIRGDAEPAFSHFSSPGELRHFRNAPRYIDSESAPLFILDGRELDANSMKQIDPSSIASIEVRKDTAATNRYGEKGRYGVLLITTKEAKK